MNGHALIPPASSLCDNNVGMTGGVKKAPIMDIKMPTLDGLEAIVQIQTAAPKTKFVILSSSARNDEVVTAKILKVCAYVINPYKAKEFLTIITKAFDQTRCPNRHTGKGKPYLIRRHSPGGISRRASRRCLP